MAANSDDPLQVAAEMQFGEIGVFTALADDDQIGGGIELPDGIHQRAVARLPDDLRDAGSGEVTLRLGKNRARLRLRDAALGLSEVDQFGQEFGGSVDPDDSGDVGPLRCQGVFEHVQDMNPGTEPVSRPSAVIVNAPCVD